MGLTLSEVTRGEWLLVGIIFALVISANLVRRLGSLLHRNLADAKLLSDDEARYDGADFDDSASENSDEDGIETSEPEAVGDPRNGETHERSEA